MEVPGGVPVKSWTHGVAFEEEARQQRNVAACHSFTAVAAMPDVHWGSARPSAA
jgi:tRNA-splicing ligase RtcB